MKNYGGTEVISLGLDVLFVAELRPRRLLHCNSLAAFAGFLVDVGALPPGVASCST
ncbi:hypothetical protein [Bradyrhizobium sp. USDA 329]|uniref:hypothetical protein n=1 Tax=unclassified Bradyrhizobium TaxID=2631580 RepID=UPI003510D5FA